MIISGIFVISSFVFNSYIIKRINDINTGLEYIAKGHYNYEIIIQGNDDITRIAENILGMKEKIIARETTLLENKKKLVQYKDELEQTVKERTFQLSKTNQELQIEVEERRKSEKNLELAKQQAESANQAKSTFLSNMSHELRTPLNAILGFAQLISHNSKIPSKERENLRIVQQNGDYLLTLINQVLDISKIEAGHITLDAKIFDLYDLLDELEGMFRLRSEIKGLSMRFEYADDVPHVIRTDDVKLRQVLINLLNNALKFTQKGGVTVRVTANPQDSASRIQFEVEDTGPGIAPAERPLLFEAFAQTETGRQIQEGTGLGLPISRKFVQLMGGEMTVTSAVGHGTTMTFHIQAEVIEQTNLKRTQPIRRAIALEPGQPRYRLLIVDDKPDNRGLLVKLLTPFGFELQEATHGQEAIDIWNAWEPHLIWMDLRMPVMGGYDATQQIRAQVNGNNTAIIAVSASSVEDERTVALSNGCDDFLRKPFHEADIFDLMQRHLGVRFVHEEETPLDTPDVTDVDLSSALAQLPPDLREQLRYAVRHSDVELMDRVIDDMRAYQPAAAAVLEKWADNFQYEQILQSLQDTT